MKTTLTVSLLLLLTQPKQEGNDIIGVWKLSENNTEIEIQAEDDRYTGTVVQSDAAKAIGQALLQDFAKDGEVWKGKFYAIKRDRLVDATLTKVDDDTLEIEVNPGGRRSRILSLTKAD